MHVGGHRMGTGRASGGLIRVSERASEPAPAANSRHKTAKALALAFASWMQHVSNTCTGLLVLFKGDTPLRDTV